MFSACFGARCVCVDRVAVFGAHKRSVIDLQRHRAVLTAIARLSCVITSWQLDR